MADRDAFGNEKGASASPIPGSPPAGAPSGLSPQPVPGATVPGPTPSGLPSAPSLSAPTRATVPSGLPPVSISSASANRSMSGRRRSNPLGLLISLLVAAAIIGIPLKLALDTKSKVDKTISNAFSTPSQPTTPGHSPTPAEPSGPPTGLSAGSMVRPVPLARAVALLRGQGKLTQLRVAPENIQAQTMTPTGRIRDIYRPYTGGSTTTTTSSGGFGSQPSIPLSKIDVYAPTRLLHHTGRHSKSINYLVLRKDIITKRVQWLAHYKNSAHYFAADAHGRHIHLF